MRAWPQSFAHRTCGWLLESARWIDQEVSGVLSAGAGACETQHNPSWAGSTALWHSRSADERLNYIVPQESFGALGASRTSALS